MCYKPQHGGADRGFSPPDRPFFFKVTPVTTAVKKPKSGWLITLQILGFFLVLPALLAELVKLLLAP